MDCSLADITRILKLKQVGEIEFNINPTFIIENRVKNCIIASA